MLQGVHAGRDRDRAALAVLGMHRHATARGVHRRDYLAEDIDGKHVVTTGPGMIDFSVIKADIEAHLTHRNLSPGAVAKRQRVSDSYVRKLFAGEGTSFSEYVLARRLVRAHRILTDRRWAAVGIASIAYDAGFGDLSYFNRTFKRCYGAAPSEVRNAD